MLCIICKLDLPSDSDVGCFETLFEYRTAECRLDWIDHLALTAFHLSLEMEITTLQRSFVTYYGLMSLGV